MCEFHLFKWKEVGENSSRLHSTIKHTINANKLTSESTKASCNQYFDNSPLQLFLHLNKKAKEVE